jgi:tetratricopeptide (TPR) repeat protein/DNA-binding XRE family transcriptional regulator
VTPDPGQAQTRFGLLLRGYRLARGLSQEELSYLAGLSVRAIINMERGKTARPYRDSVRALADALDLHEPEREQLILASRRFAHSGPAPGPAVPGASDGAPPPPPAAAASRALSASPASPVPRQLPASVACFVGRTRELRALTAISNQVTRAGAAAVVSSIGGTAGVGKTALAVHWAHKAAGRFPDGQLYVNLQGYDLSGPLTVEQALAGFLTALGVPAATIPAGAEQMAAMYRSRLAGRRLLVVLDNANHVEQVRLLLPGTSGCMALVTSRDSLPGLVARDGARRLTVDLLPRTEALRLLRTLVGRRVDAEPIAAEALTTQCCRLPLALRLAAELAAARPAAKLADLVDQLTGEQRRLDLLDAGDDPHTAVRTVFSWSYLSLPPNAAEMFRLLGRQPCAGVDMYSASALGGIPLQSARRVLDQLARAHLIQSAEPVRYGMHDLLRAYARELAAAQELKEATDAALTRLFDYYLFTASFAMDVLFPAERGHRPRITQPATPVPAFNSDRPARAWLDAERANLVAVMAYMTSRGRPTQAIQLASTLFRYLDAGSHFAEAELVHTFARQAASQLGDHAAEATALVNLGSVSFRQGHHQQAASYFSRALELYTETDDPQGRIRALNNLGLANLEMGKHALASQHFRDCLSLSDETGERLSGARALANLAVLDLKRSNYGQAISQLELALSLFRDVGDPMGEASALIQLALIDLRQHDPAGTSVRAREALKLYRKTGDRAGEADALVMLAEAKIQLGTYLGAMRDIRRSLWLHQKTGSKSGEARALNVLGDILLATERPEQALGAHIGALRISSQTGDREEEARSHRGLAAGYESTGDFDSAHTHQVRALGIDAALDGATEPAGALGQQSPSR